MARLARELPKEWGIRCWRCNLQLNGAKRGRMSPKGWCCEHRDLCNWRIARTAERRQTYFNFLATKER